MITTAMTLLIIRIQVESEVSALLSFNPMIHSDGCTTVVWGRTIATHSNFFLDLE